MTVLDDLMPTWDARRVEQRMIAAPSSIVLDSVMRVDFLDAVRRNTVVKFLFAMRSAMERGVAGIRRRAFVEPPTPMALRLTDLPSNGEWVRLGETETEIAFGVIGRFWDGETRWQTIEAADFAAFSQPGYARIGCSLHVSPLSENQTLLRYEARTISTDARSRRAFLRYWRVVSPFVGIVMRATLAVVADAAESTLPENHRQKDGESPTNDKSSSPHLDQAIVR